ncbi:MAG: hypothetical protein KIT27_09660 [Legionellales bacterium]|nr:hypothetical protein [Legionellales bacterium]
MRFLRKIILYWRKKLRSLKELAKSESLTPLYRVVSIEEISEGEYSATVQIINTNRLLPMKPEAVLADDKLTNCFSPTDVRTLTYLGYLGINSPRYKILAKRLLEKEKKLIFAIKEKGSNKILTKTAEEITADPDLIRNLNQSDAHSIGYTYGSQSMRSEKEEMDRLIQEKINRDKRSKDKQ